jgi:hypothetical protein
MNVSFSSRTKTIIVMFMFVSVLYVIYIVNKTLVSTKKVESFEEEKKLDEEESTDKESKKDGTASKEIHESSYKNRLYVMKMFESMFKRKPTTDEIEKYIMYGSEKTILTAILEDYDQLEHKSAMNLIPKTKEINKAGQPIPFDTFADTEERVSSSNVTKPSTAETAQTLSASLFLKDSKELPISREADTKAASPSEKESRLKSMTDKLIQMEKIVADLKLNVLQLHSDK